MKRFRKGAASFYIVSFSTLILVIIAASFATVIISEVTRSSNDDLSQSAYDSALAGVEDAKVAYANYRRCVEAGYSAVESIDDTDNITCGKIIRWMENPDCDMVGHMTGRTPASQNGEVMISDTTNTNVNDGTTSNMNQAYTCAEIKTVLRDYRANLTSSTNTRLVKVELNNVNAADINAVELSWYSVREGETFNYSNFNSGEVTFKPISEIRASSPPTIELQMIQTAQSFTLDQLNGATVGGTTDRATMFFVPVSDKGSASGHKDGNYVGIYKNDKNELTAAQVAKTNDRSVVNVPYVTYCDDRTQDDFMCRVKINLPQPIGGARSNETFMFLVTVPYGEPDTDFSLSFLCTDGRECSKVVNSNGETISSNVAEIKGVQIVIDSTGRANDLYRRVETRLESVDISFPYITKVMELFSTDSGMVLEKDLKVTSEYNRTGYYN